ncbi:glucose-6-phosphatase 2 [Stomoxys calcitrans]|uniref:glucose-6-phosphatase n=1 Tax=Stomoxys calcitrans TaxID=35570 RepID=A0A1I8Q3Z1_STOCA|nr:glucose-6-phosphatase 2 [Stomoxys calcitrans]
MSAASVYPSYLTRLYELEIGLNRNVQKQMRNTEPLLQDVNTYLDPQMIMDAWLPLVGTLSHKLLVRMAVSVSLLNLLTSLIKWIAPEHRPIWWLKEYNSRYKFKGFNTGANTCDTSAGFPSSHSVTFTAFAFIFFHWLLLKLGRQCHMSKVEKCVLTHAMVSLPLILLWCGRLYFLTEFLHQCIGGSILAMAGIHFLNRNTAVLLKFSKLCAVMFVVAAGMLPLGIYFAMLHLDEDPHWSVRMAFKWCSEVTSMRHEAGPIYVLFRDYGYLLGVALSCPMLQSYKNGNNNNIYKRLPATLLLIFLNFTALQNTPKHMGRWVFLIYELVRNCVQSYTLLSIFPKICK